MIIYKVSEDNNILTSIEASFNETEPLIPITIVDIGSDIETTIILNKKDAKYFGESLIKLSEEI